MDLIILLVLITLIVIIRKDFKSFIYSLGAIEILFRVLHFLGDNLGITELSKFISANIPKSIISIFANYFLPIIRRILKSISYETSKTLC